MASTLDRMVAGVADVLTLVDRYLTGSEQLLRLLGWEPPPGGTEIGLAAVDLSSLLDKVNSLRQTQVSGTDEQIAAAFADLAVGVADAFGQLRRAAAGFSATPDYLSRTHIVAEFFPRLLDMVVMQSVARLSPPAFAVAQLGGIFLVEPHPADPANFQTEHLRHVVRWDRIGTALHDPGQLFHDVYGWGTPDFDAAALIANIGSLLQLVSVSTAMRSLPARAEQQLSGQPVPAGAKPSSQVLISVAKALGLDDLDVGLSLFGLHPTTPGGADGGIGVTPYLRGTTDLSFPLADRLAFTVDSTIDLEGGVALILRPGHDPQLKSDLNRVVDGATAAAGKLVLAIRTEAEPGTVLVLLDLPQAARLEAKALSVGGGVQGGRPSVTFALEGGHLVIDTSGGDGFISTVLGDAKIEGTFDLTASYAPGTGLQLGGSGGLALQLPLHLTLGPVTVEQLYVALGIAAGGVQLELSAGLSANLGPVQAAVDRVGMTAELTFPDGGGNLGPADLTFGFKPPNGIGLSLDAGLIAGGGYLFADPDRGEYAGALDLQFGGFLALKAIGLISTRMPDGSAGFSLLVVITTEFGGTGIALGEGFFLLAVGGVLGLNRGMNRQALIEGVRTGAVESVLFPKDVVANAPRILSDLRGFFPPQEGTFLVGPMAKIGWGTPTLISLSVGVILEIPGDVAILGVLKAALPNPAAPLLLLQVDFAGVLEFDRQRLYFVAQLVGSRILTMPINGGMGVLVAWGDNPDLVVTVGGFHPSFRPPALPFPVPDRLSMDILNEPHLLIRVAGYFAITSNTVQFGAKAELRLGFSDFGIEGHVAFDALFQISPFRFNTSTSASVSLKAFGVGLFSIHLKFQLEGPAPWRARGRGSIGFLFFEISADFDKTWGESRDTSLPPLDVLTLLATELGKAEGWQTRLPTGRSPLVTLRALPPGDQLVLHPLGSLVVRQRAVPLDVRVDQVGGRPARDGGRFSVAPVGTDLSVAPSVPSDKFAMAQYQTMSDAAKLSLPAYADQDAGLELAGQQGLLASARAVRRSARYELIITDSRARAATTPATAELAAVVTAPAPRRLISVSPAVFGQFLAGSSTSRSTLSQQDATRRQPFAGDTVRLGAQRFVVAYVRTNLQAFPPGTGGLTTGTGAATFRSQAAAADALAEWVAAVPGLAGTLHVIPASDAAAPLAVPGTWAAGVALPSAAAWDTAGNPLVPLADGRWLVAGGAAAGGAPLATVQLFDPVANAWSAGPALTVGRTGHTSTRLPDGRVLVTGGFTADGATGSAEIFDPLANTWTATAAMLGTGRYGHSATVLPDGSVLVAGGTGMRGSLIGAERFDPSTGRWSAADPMTDARSGHHAVPLPGGPVLLIGGTLATGGPAVATGYCEVYDPATGHWLPTGSLATARVGHQATVLGDGSVLVTGGDTVGRRPGGRYDARSLDTAERYDPGRGEWQPAPSMPTPRTRHRALALSSGQVLVVGGTAGPAFAGAQRRVAVFEPGTGAWTTTGALAAGRWAHAAADLADGRIVTAGGRLRAGAVASGPEGDLTASTEIFTP